MRKNSREKENNKNQKILILKNNKMFIPLFPVITNPF